MDIGQFVEEVKGLQRDDKTKPAPPNLARWPRPSKPLTTLQKPVERGEPAEDRRPG